MDLNILLGPIVIAVTLNAMIYGTCIVQWFNYYNTGFKDPLLTRLLVAWVVFLDTLHTGCTIYMLWDFTVTNFGNLAILAKPPWVYPTTPIFIVLASVPIQHFLAWRIKNLYKSWILFFVVSFLSFAQAGCAFAGGIMANIMIDPASFGKLVGVADGWIATSMFTDILITALLLYYLHRHRTGFKKTDSVISSLVRIIIETSAISAIFCLLDIITFTTHTTSNMHIIFSLAQGRIYTNTLMLTLNSRTGLRSEMNSNNLQSFEVTNGIASGVRPTEVNIAVSRDIQMDRVVSRGGSNSHADSFFDDSKVAAVA